MRKALTPLLLFMALLQTARAQTITPVDGDDVVLKNYTTSWIANDGGWEEVHIPHDMLGMDVYRDGTVATICGWDEGGTNVGVFRDGKLISRPEGSGTGGWGRFSGAQVALDDKYVYQLLTQHGCDGGNDELNVNGLRQFPPCDNAIEWKTVRRYDRETGLGAPFKGGYGYRGDMLVVASDKTRQLKGMAITEDRIYVAITGQEDSIKIYNKNTMQYLRGYPVKGGLGILAADRKGGLWMMQDKRIIHLQAETGKRLPQLLDIPADARVIYFNIDNLHDRLLLPNRGRDMDILVYNNIYKQPQLQETWGQKGGVFAQTDSYKAGQAGPWRFSGPTGAGVDAKGRIYVCNTTVSGGRGAIVESYDPKSHRQLWKREGLIFTATADFDRADNRFFFTPEKIHRIFPDRKGDRLDTLVAYTADPFRFPDDERVKEKDAAFVTSTFMRNIEGHKFLFVSDMYGGFLAGYRFDLEKTGYVGIPFLTTGNGDPDKDRPIQTWVDQDGDGHCQEDEYQLTKEINQYSMSFFVDQQGNIWRGTREKGVMYWHMKGLDPYGVPQYEEPQLLPLPDGFMDAKRVYYDPERDELFLAGNSRFNPDTHDTWWAMCGTIVRCNNFLSRLKAGQIKEGWQSDLSVYIPFHIEDGSGLDHTNAKAFTVAGDYIIVVLAREGWITIYNRQTGQFVGRLQPTQNVHGQSGWADFNYAINARQMPDGSYEILVEENAFGKVLHYKWIP